MPLPPTGPDAQPPLPPAPPEKTPGKAALNLVRPEGGDGFPSRLPGHGPGGKILDHEQLLRLRAAARAAGKQIVHCHGCFDIVHPGHLRHLRHARSHGDLLLVSITGDVEMKKGTGRPLIPEELRAENLAALDCVDLVYIEQRPTARELLDEVRPDVYVKGKEYELNSDPRFLAERGAVESHGGRVVFSSGDVVFSSTALIAALEQSIDPYHARLRQLLSMPELDGVELSRTISRFRGKRVLVVGEVILDTYVLCDRPDVAGEAPVMTLRPLERRMYDGAAAIIARHLAAMGASPVLVTGLPKNDQSAMLRQRLLADGVEVRSIEVDTNIPEKQRFLVGAQKVMKIDLLERLELDAAQQDELVALATDTARELALAPCQSTEVNGGNCDAAIIADFGLGLLPQSVLAKLCPALRRNVGIMAADVSGRRSNLRMMRDMDLVCPSESELRQAYTLHDQGLSMVAWRLLADTRSRAALITLGADGLIAFDRLSAPVNQDAGFASHVRGEHVPALSGHAVDALGCGDSMLAAATLALTTGAPLLSAAFIASVAAAIQVQRLGNTVISATDLRQALARLHSSHLTYTSPEVIEARGMSPSARRAPAVAGAGA